MKLDDVREKLNTKFGEGEFDDFLKIGVTRLRLDFDDCHFILSTNTGDNRSAKIIESLGFEIIKVDSIIDARYVHFKEAAQ